VSLETTQSRGHAWPSAKQASTDVGGNFTTIKTRSISNPNPNNYETVRVYGEKYIGPAWASNPFNAITYGESLVQPTSDVVLGQYGTKAISNCIPTNPVADGATFLGELKEGLPKLVGKSLVKSAFKDYRKYGSEYVNIEFGWKPFVSDLKKFYSAATESEKILKQLERDSGKNIRRKYTFPDEVSTNTFVYPSRYAYLPGGQVLSGWLYDSAGTLTVKQKVTVKTWFSGCFTYHLNLGTRLPDKMARYAAEARKISGLELTPEVVWNLTPWSWAVDWEGSFGDVLHNVSRFSQDGLVLRYGYIMQSKTAELEYTLYRGGLNTGRNERDLSFTSVSESKVRRYATPFGFGFDMKALSGRQSAILEALGISRGPRRL
jgi:hypothetical protein